MREAFDGIEEIPHPEEAALGSARSAARVQAPRLSRRACHREGDAKASGGPSRASCAEGGPWNSIPKRHPPDSNPSDR